MIGPFCVDCKHARGDPPYKLTCNSPRNVVEYASEERYLVSGIIQIPKEAMRGATCAALRKRYPQPTDATVCGPEGKWFEAKE